MPENDQAAQAAVDAIYNYAAEQMVKGVPNREIEKDLIQQGLTAETAGIVVQNLKEARSKAIKESGQKNMLYGALWCIGGIIVTAATLQAANGPGGGKYVIAWGAIVFGAIQFFHGLIQSSGESK